MANAVDASGGCGGGGGLSGSGRAPRLPRWTRQEILVLIQGKRVVEGKGRGRGRPAAALVGGGRPVEPKWASVSAYCRRHGVDRGAVQCRKRWSNLAGDYKKIKEWEEGKGVESFWAMRNDARRERRLPGFFDREVYDILDGAAVSEVEAAKGGGGRKGEEPAAAADDTGRQDGLFSDTEDDREAAADEEDEEEEQQPADEERLRPPAAAVAPISEKKSETSHQESSEQGTAKDKHPADNPEKGSPSQEPHKRRRLSPEGTGDSTLQSQLIEVLDRNSRTLASHLEAQNINCQLDRDQRKHHAEGLLNILGKLADAVGRIADKL